MTFSLTQVSLLTSQSEHALFLRLLDHSFLKPSVDHKGRWYWNESEIYGWMLDQQVPELHPKSFSQMGLHQVLAYTMLTEQQLLREVRRGELPVPFEGPSGSCYWWEDAVTDWLVEEHRSLRYERDPRAGGP